MAIPLLALLLLQTPAPPAPATALIVGRVVEAGTTRPVPGATVSISGLRLPGGGVPPRLMTDAQGRFVYRNLPAGSYGLTVMKNGYVDGAYGRVRPGGGAQQLELSAGERATDVTIGIWKFATIAGTVVDEAGEPVVGATVQVRQRTYSGGRRALRPVGLAGGTISTDDRGMYRLARLTPGHYIVMVDSKSTSLPASVVSAYRAASGSREPAAMELRQAVSGMNRFGGIIGEGVFGTRIGDHVWTLEIAPAYAAGDGAAMVYPKTYHPGVPVMAQATVVNLRAGEERLGVDVQLKPVPAVRVSGTIVGPEGPAGTVAVRLHPKGNDEFHEDPETAATVSDATGAFTFLAVPSGDYTLRVTRVPSSGSTMTDATTTVIQTGGGNSFMSVSSGGVQAQPLPSAPTLWAAIPLQVGRRDVVDIAVPLQHGGRITGRVEFDGTAERPGADVARRMTVALDPVGANGGFSGVRPGQVDSDFTFKTMSVVAGKYVLRPTGALPGWTFKSAMFEGRDLADIPFEISSGDMSGVVLTFTDRPAEVSGTVSGASGGPDPDATVLVFPTDTNLLNGTEQSRRARSVRTTKTGTFSIRPLPSGSYYIVAIPDELSADWTDPRFLEALSRDATQVQIDDGVKKTQNLRTVRPRRDQ